MDLRKINIGLAILLASCSANAAPLVAFLGQTLFSVAGIAVTVGQVIFTAGSLLFGSAQQRKLKKRALAEQKRQKDEYNAGLSDRTVNGIGSEFPARHVFGTARIGGNIVDIITSGEKDEYQHLIVLATQHQVEDFPEVYINGKAVGALDVDGFATAEPFGKTVTASETATIAASSNVTTLPHTPDTNSVLVTVVSFDGENSFNQSIPFTLVGSDVTSDAAYLAVVKTVTYTRQKAESAIRITKHLGIPGGSYDVNTNVETAGKLKTTSVFNGHSYLAIRLDLNEPEFQNLPAVEMLVKRDAMFDVRTGTTSANAGTNPALVAHEYLKGDLCSLEDITLPTAQYITAANDCDVIVNNGDGNRKRYTFNGMISSDQSREEVLQRIADSMAGGIVATTWDIYAGVYRAPVMSLNETDIVGSLSVSPGSSELEIFNTVYGRYATADNAYLEKDYRRYIQSTYVTADGGELETGITYPFTITQTEVDQLNRIATEQARNDFTINATFSLKAWKLKVGDRIFWTSPFMGQTDQTYRVVDRSSGSTSGVTLMLKYDTEEMYDLYDAVALPSVPPSTLPNPWLVQPPTITSVESGTSTLTPQGEGSLIAGMRVTWVNSSSPTNARGNVIEIEAERLTGIGLPDVLRLTTPDISTDALLNPAQAGETYRVRLRAANLYTGAASVWVYHEPHIVVGKEEPPPPFDIFFVTAGPDGTRQYNFSYTSTQQPIDWLGAQIRYTPGNVVSPVWETMIPLQDGETYYTNSPVERNAPIEGEYTFACRSLDSSENLSTAIIRTVTLGARRTGRVFAEFNERNDSWSGTLSGFNEYIDPVNGGSYLESIDTDTWDTPAIDLTWAAPGFWNGTPTSPCTYTTLVKDLGTVLTGQIDVPDLSVDGLEVLEIRTSIDNITFTSWGAVSASFSARYVQLRVTVTATGGEPVPAVYDMQWQVSADLKREYLDDYTPADFSGAYRIAVGDIRVPTSNTYSVIKTMIPTIQDPTGVAWDSAVLIDKDVAQGWRWQFRKAGVLSDPPFLDFYIEGI